MQNKTFWNANILLKLSEINTNRNIQTYTPSLAASGYFFYIEPGFGLRQISACYLFFGPHKSNVFTYHFCIRNNARRNKIHISTKFKALNFDTKQTFFSRNSNMACGLLISCALFSPKCRFISFIKN